MSASTLDVMAFLGRRHSYGSHRWVGLSSDALVWHAITGDPPTERPYDAGDLARCLVTRALAPFVLHERMDVLLAEWSAGLERERPGTVAEAEKLRDEWLPVVRGAVA